ncbi:hypothetical protein Golax_024338 [Gossypium laxum]|uniref:Uncharacterized protein n=1 Tax=Gossypium laxum TaxID=34288 RepID=A0A7J8ZCG0_9ROSI|nr:hypothetical protein [Gossypium laxum]
MDEEDNFGNSRDGLEQ